jgi:hypothetical protein
MTPTELATLSFSGVAALAAVAAAFIPLKINRDAFRLAERERATEARCLATALWRQGTGVERQLQLVRQTAEEKKRPKQVNPNLFAYPRDTLIAEFQMQVSPILVTQFERVWILGPVLGPKLMELASLLVVYNLSVREHITSLETYPTMPDTEVVIQVGNFEVLAKWETQLSAIEALLRETQTMLQAIHEGAPVPT